MQAGAGLRLSDAEVDLSDIVFSGNENTGSDTDKVRKDTELGLLIATIIGSTFRSDYLRALTSILRVTRVMWSAL